MITYYSLGKVFEKQVQPTENQGEKEIKATEEHGEQLAESNVLLKRYDYDNEEDSPDVLKQKKTNELID